MKILQVLGELALANGVATFVRGIDDGLAAYPEVTCEVWEESHPVPEKLACDILHIHGLWRPQFHRMSALARSQRIPVVWSPHGMLQPWALKNKWWKKFAALALYQWRDLRSAALLHATAASEVEDLRRLGLRNRVVVVPLGVKPPACRATSIRPAGASTAKTLLFVSRVQRKKGLPNLLAAWKALEKEKRKAGELAGWRLRIVGPDEDGHTAELQALCEKLGITDEVEFAGPKYGEELAREYDHADLFVLPTHSENFGSVVIEALAHAVPVITTKAAPWQELTLAGNRCGWWVEDAVPALAAALQEAMTLPPSTLKEFGANGRRLVEAKYTWPAVAKRMLEGYQRL